MANKQKIIYLLIIIPFIFYFSTRSIKQIKIFLQAKNLVDQTQVSIDGLRAENRRLKGLVDYSQTTDFLDREARERFALGNQGDAFLVLPSQAPNADFDLFYPESKNPDKPSNLSLWLALFQN